MVTRDIIDRQADTIQYVLHTHGIRARIDDANFSPRLTHFHLSLPPGVQPAQVAHLVPELADTLGVTACRLAVNSADSEVYLEVPRPDPTLVKLIRIVQQVAEAVPPVAATLGPDGNGNPLLLRLDSPEIDPLLVSGDPGAGKSYLLRSIALSLALHNSPGALRLLLLDCTGEGVAFAGMEGLPHLACPVANGPVDAMVSLRWAIRTLERRSHMAGSEEEENELTFDDPGDVKYGPAPSLLDEPALVVLIDGVEFLCASGDRRTATEAVAALRRLLAEGSGCRLHVVAATERPDIMISAGMGWRARITGQVSSPEAARMASGVKGSGAQGLLGEGDFVITVNAELIRFQAAAASADDVIRAIGFIHDRMREVQAQEQTEPQADELPFLRNAGVRRTIEPVRAKPPAQVPQQVARPAAQRRWGAESR